MHLDDQELERCLAGLPMGGLRYFEQIDSTNVEAARWAEHGASDLALVVADEQTAGKGRLGRSWFTPPGSALAFSLILRQSAASPNLSFSNPTIVPRLTALGTLAVCEALENRYHLQPQIKWPNDVLLVRRKTCGVLVEAHWQGDRLSAVILGIGINIAATSVPPDEQVRYPATCVENATGYPVNRLELLRSVLESVIAWRSLLDTARFISAWNQRLAFKGEWAELAGEPGPEGLTAGRIMGLDEDGGLILRDHAGRDHTIITGELRLRSTDA